MIPEKLKVGDEVRIIAPSRTMAILKEDCINFAIKRLESLGLKISFAKHVNDFVQMLKIEQMTLMKLLEIKMLKQF